MSAGNDGAREVELTEAESEALDYGRRQANMALDRILAERLRQVEAERDHWKKAAEQRGQTMNEALVRSQQMLERAMDADRAIGRVQALYGGEPPPIWIKDTKIVRATYYDRGLCCDVTTSLLRLDDVRAALNGGDDA